MDLGWFSTVLRQSAFFILLLGFVLLQPGCGVVVRGMDSAATAVSNASIFHNGRHGELTEQEKEWAKIAWRYFKNNYNSYTGFVNSIDKYPTTTMSTVADHIAAMIAAYEFELIDQKSFDERFSTLLSSLNSMALFKNRLPNKVYSAKSKRMVDYNNQPKQIGWSALDIGRLLIWLKIAEQRHPKYSEYINKAIMRWHFCDVIDACGSLYGGALKHGKVRLFQEGRLGFEEYAAKGFQAWGFSTKLASQTEPYKYATIYDYRIPYDARIARETGAYSPVITLPYVFQGLEFNWDKTLDNTSSDKVHTDTEIATLADLIYKVQAERFKRQKIFTARTDHPMAKAPFFLHDSIYAEGYAWNALSDKGGNYEKYSLVSTRAAFGMWGLWKTDYTDQLIDSLEMLYSKKRGWYEGRYERTGGYDRTISATTNAVVLETLLHKVEGKLFQALEGENYLSIRLMDAFQHPGKCFTPKQPICTVAEVN